MGFVDDSCHRGRGARRWWNMYENKNRGSAWWTAATDPIFSLIQLLSLPNPDKHRTDKAKSESMNVPNSDGLTGVPATVMFVLCGPQCPTWWRCGRRLLKTAASGQGPTTGLLYYLEGTEREKQVKGRCYDLTSWLHLVPAGRKFQLNTSNLKPTTAGGPSSF